MRPHPGQLALIATALTLGSPGARAAGDDVAIRWVDPPGQVELTGLGGSALGPFGLKSDPSRFTIRLARPAGEPEAGPMAASIEVVAGTARLRPRFPLRPGLRYLARYQPEAGRAVETIIAIPDEPESPATEVIAISPGGDDVPENLLKLYLTFSAPMGRGDAYQRVKVIDEAGAPVDRPFFEIGQELWDPSMTRLTLLFDPGRIKRGLVPREEEGPILVAGQTYRVVVDPAWPDASGRPLARPFRKSYRAGPADEAQPDPAAWTFEPPARGGRSPLIVRFPEPLDAAMLRRAITVRVADRPIAGTVDVGPEGQAWRLTPAEPWPSGAMTLDIDSELEDLAGNSLARPFEVDEVEPRPSKTGPRVTVPIPSGARGSD